MKYFEQRPERIGADRRPHRPSCSPKPNWNPRASGSSTICANCIAEWKRNEELLERRKSPASELSRRRSQAEGRPPRAASRSMRRRQSPAQVARRGRARSNSCAAAIASREHATSCATSTNRSTREITRRPRHRGTEEELRTKIENFDCRRLEQRWTELCDRLARHREAAQGTVRRARPAARTARRDRRRQLAAAEAVRTEDRRTPDRRRPETLGNADRRPTAASKRSARSTKPNASRKRCAKPRATSNG